MSFKISGWIFFHLPVGNAAGPANAPKPFVSEPACRPAVSGVFNHKGFVAVGYDPGLISDSINRLNSVQQPFARRPEFYFFNEPKQFNPFAVEAFSRLFSCFFLCHVVKSPGNGSGSVFWSPGWMVQGSTFRVEKSRTALVIQFPSMGNGGYSRF